jgi:hypothetical protein
MWNFESALQHENDTRQILSVLTSLRMALDVLNQSVLKPKGGIYENRGSR